MDVKLPNLGEGADSGTVINVFVKVGDRVEKDQPLLELENEKAIATIPATAAGLVSQVYVKAGDRISAGARIVTLGDGAPAPAPVTPPAATPVLAPGTNAAPAPVVVAAPATAPAPAGVAALDELLLPPGQREAAAAPSLRKLAADLGLDLSRIRGTGAGGRVLLTDVRNLVQRLLQIAATPPPAPVVVAAPAAAAAPKPPAERIDFAKWGPVTRQPLTQLRKVIARRMTENWNAIPHVTQFDNADVSGLNELRLRHAAAFEQKGARLTLTPFLLKAVALTLGKHPIFNASLDEVSEEIVFKDYCHLGIAVDTEAGLIVPVLRDADKKSLLEIALELEVLAKKARDRKVGADDLKGGTFTISNQGGIGGAHFTPIVNKPEVAILGLGRSAPQAVVREGRVEARPLLPLALSYDHRLIDGGSAARFMVDLVRAVENFPDAAVA